MTATLCRTVDTDEALAALLASLGDTPDQIAATLTAAEITGHPGQAGRCPIANWIRATCGNNDWAPLVSNDTVDLHIDDDTMFRAATPAPVDVFITRFDADMYPTLEAPDDWQE
jgi:hypothetical protein